MKKSLSRAVAVTATCAAGLAGALVHSPSATADQTAPATASAPAAKVARSNFGFKADVFGTKVLLNGVEVGTAKDAYAKLACTRVIGRQKVVPSLASLPIDNDIIDLGLTKSETNTYQEGARVGVRGVSTLAFVKLGGSLPGGIKTPVLNIEGLQSTADAFFDKSAAGGQGAFKHDESFRFQGISLEMPEGSITDQVPGLDQLLEIVNQVLAPVNQIVNQLIQLLTRFGTIKIPGLGEIGLGQATGKASAKSATSQAYALKINVNPTGEKGKDTLLQLGRAFTRVSKGVPSGVFNSTMSALDMSAANDTLRLGNIGKVSIPCEGTNGRTVKKKISHVNLGLGSMLGLVDLSGIEYSYRGNQLAKGRMRGFVQSKLGVLRVPLVDLTIEGITSRLALSRKPGQPAKRTMSTSLGRILVGDTVLPLPTLDRPTEFDGGLIRLGKVQKRYHGGTLRAIEVVLPGLGSLLTVGTASGSLLPK